MITIHHLKPAKGAIKSKKRIGRGQGSTKGGTSTRGHKGAQSRSGYKVRHPFEGGQTPLIRRAPKLPRPNHTKQIIKVINLNQISHLATTAKTTEITPQLLQAHRYIKAQQPYKVLAKGTLNQPLTITANAFSQKAQKAIQSLKGKVITL